MFQMTLRRVMDRSRYAPPIIVANAVHAQVVEDQLHEIGIDDAIVLLEPCPRNTAPAIALAALAMNTPASPMLVMPSDHVILDEAAFDKATEALLPLVNDGYLATYGISPTGPETGYGYIQLAAKLAPGVNMVSRFVEKPDQDRAVAMIAGGDFVWNGGIFLFRADQYLAVMAAHAPDMLLSAKAAMASGQKVGRRFYPDETAFASCPSDSIDYAVMEKADRVIVAPVAMGWSDVGSWDALHQIGTKDENGNSMNGAVRLSHAKGNMIHADGIRISVHGVNDLIIVANGSEVIVMPRGTSQKVRDFATD